MNEAQKVTIEALSRQSGKALDVGPIAGWQHRCRSGELQVLSDSGIRVAISRDGKVSDIDLGSFLQSSPPHGNETPQNRFRVAVLALRYGGRNFSEICNRAGGTKAQFDMGLMPGGLPATGSGEGHSPATIVRPCSSPAAAAAAAPALVARRAKPDPYRFTLQFSASEIPSLVARRLTNVEQERAFEAGGKIRDGEYSRENVRIIIDWKIEPRYLGRVLSYFDRNSETEVARALQIAVSPTDERTAIQVLDALHGVGVPVASAIVTTIHPEKYTIIDVNALAALGISDGPTDDVNYYLAYLRNCRQLAQQLKISLRVLDHALWQWGHEH